MRLNGGRTLQQGATMLEVLVSCVIFSVGFLLLMLHLSSALAVQKNAQFQSIAVQLAADYADRLRVDRSTRNADPLTRPIPLMTCLQDRACSAAEWSASDHPLWLTQVQQVLPQGQALVRQGLGEPGQWELVIAWTEALPSAGREPVPPSACLDTVSRGQGRQQCLVFPLSL